MTTPDTGTPARAQEALYMDYADYLAIKAAWDARRDELERIIYDCVSLSDIMRNGHSEALYRSIITKYEATPAAPAGDEEA